MYQPDPAELIRLLELQGRGALRDGRYRNAQELYQHALTKREQQGDTDPVLVLPTLMALGEIALALAQFPSAEMFLLHAQTLCRKAHGEDHQDTITCQDLLAQLDEQRGRYSRAKAGYLHLITHCERALGRSHVLTARAYGRFAAFQRLVGHHAIAQEFFSRCLLILEQDPHPSGLDLACVLTESALWHLDRQHPDEAQPLLHRALVLWKRHLGDDHPHSIPTLKHLGMAAAHKGQYEQAMKYYEQANLIGLRIYGNGHPMMAGLLLVQADLRAAMKRPLQAAIMAVRAEVVLTQMLGPQHPHTQVAQTLAQRLATEVPQESRRFLTQVDEPHSESSSPSN